MFCKPNSDEVPFVIAEVGQNHNGDLDLAREFIRIFAFEGADAVKFQTRNNKYLFSKDAYEADYGSENYLPKFSWLLSILMACSLITQFTLLRKGLSQCVVGVVMDCGFQSYALPASQH